jgi:hypothetical protein
MTQLAYSQYGAAALKGMLFDLSDYLTQSFAAQGTVAPSQPVTLGTNKEKQCVQQTGAVGQGALVIGFAMANTDMEQSAAGVVQFADKESLSVLKRGRMWVETSAAVTAGNVANLTLATGKLTDAAVAAGIEAFTQIRVRFLTSTTGAGLAAVEVTPI